ncbi:ROK family protein [Methylobacterium sp. ID0610]|uniref:ROK family protein n=1 Tax=Methylobacterium carpenticola TaxID=3344827 RepID=UPI0036CE59C5
MATSQAPSVSEIPHAAGTLPAVTVDSYNIELRQPDDEGFLGDRVTKGAFRDLVEDWRERLRKLGDDPLGETPSRDLAKKTLDRLLREGSPEAAGVVQGAVEDFSQELATVVRRFLRQKGWRDTERIVVGGGLSDSYVGRLAIGRASVLLRAAGIDLSLVPIRHHHDEGGLIGAVHLAPAWIFSGYDSLLAIDIGGTNIRVGIVATNLRKAADLSRAAVWRSELWRHRDEEPPPTRDAAVARIVAMLESLVARAEKADLALAPFIGVGCPGVIEPDGQISRGGQNLPGNWESSRFNLPRALREALPTIGGHETMVVMHNDAVVQGLSEVPFQQDIVRWGVLTIGTGLGNARFGNRDGAGS